MISFKHLKCLFLACIVQIFFGIILTSSSIAETKDNPEAARGVLDLKAVDWRFDSDGAVLIPQWLFFGNQLLSDEDFTGDTPPVTDTVMNWPSFWPGLATPDGPMPRYGYATLYLEIRFAEPTKGLGLRMGRVFTEYQLTANGEVLAAAGRVGTDRASAVPNGKDNFVRIPDGIETLRLVLQISNFSNWLGGGSQFGSIIGDYDAINQDNQHYAYFFWFIGGTFIILAFYHLGIYSLRTEDKSALWFALFCLGFVVRVFTQLYNFMYDFNDGEYYYLAAKLNWFSIYSFTPLFALLVNSVYPKDTHKWVISTSVFVGATCALLILVLPLEIFSRSVYYYVAFSFAVVFYANYVSIVALIRRREQSVLFFASLFVFSFTMIGSVLDVTQIFSTRESLPLGFLVFAAGQAFLLSQRFSRSFKRVEALSAEMVAKNEHLQALSNALSENNERLQKIDKLKEQFLANTSHELRTPLNGIIGLTDSIRAGAKGPINDDVDRTLEMISASGRRLSKLVNDILDSAKLGNRELELSRSAVDLHEIVEIDLHISRPLVGSKSIELFNRVPIDLPLVDADEDRLQQILQNLIGNAIKFTEKGHVTVTAKERGRMVLIEVEDTGIGIPEDKFDTIFDSFQQVDPSIERKYGGTGLGLSITKNLVLLHGGEIWVESEPGAGSRFCLTLPTASDQMIARTSANLVPGDSTMRPILTGEPVPSAGMPDRSRVAAAGETVRNDHSVLKDAPKSGGDRMSVLIVDDDEVNRHVVANFLGLEAYDVYEAEDGIKALEVMSARRPDLILLDIMMPRLNGFEVCRKIRAETDLSDTPVIFLSAKDRTEDLLAGFESGGNDYLTKPVSGPELIARVETHAKFSRLKAEAVRQEKLAAIGQMAAGIVHDFKNSIGVIKGYAEMIAEDDLDDRLEAAEFATTIASEADRISSMAYDILEYSRGELTLDRSNVTVSTFLEDVRIAIAPYFSQRGLAFTVTDAPDATISIDRRRMVRAFANIAGNAAESLSSEPLAAEGRFALSARLVDDGVEFELRDNGPGIPAHIRDTLFDAFVTHGKEAGTGLGLALAKSTVDAHGGSIRFETERGKGTAFFIVLGRI